MLLRTRSHTGGHVSDSSCFSNPPSLRAQLKQSRPFVWLLDCFACARNDDGSSRRRDLMVRSASSRVSNHEERVFARPEKRQ